MFAFFVNCIFHSQFTTTMQFIVPYDKTNILMIVLLQSENCVQICDNLLQICDFKPVRFRGVRKITLRDN